MKSFIITLGDITIKVDPEKQSVEVAKEGVIIPPKESEEAVPLKESEETVPVKRGRGRPKGSTKRALDPESIKLYRRKYYIPKNRVSKNGKLLGRPTEY